MLCEIHFQEGPQRDSSILKTFTTSRKGSFGQGNIFTDVCLSTGGRCLYDVTSCLVAWCHVSSRRGVSVPGPIFLLAGGRICVQGGLCTGRVSVRGMGSGSLSGGRGLCSGRSLSSEGGLCTGGSLSGRPPYDEEWAVRILLECFLVLEEITSL